MAEFVQIFFAGVLLANGPCFFFCAPIVLPCITGIPSSGGASSTWREGLRHVLVFSFFRLLSYAVLGMLAVALYRFVFSVIAPSRAYLQSVLGVLIVAIGVFYLIKSSRKSIRKKSSCESCSDLLPRRTLWHMALAGLLIGFSPCPPLLAMLTYIAATADGLLWGLSAGAVFGLGTVLTPLIPAAVFTGFLMGRMEKFPRTLFFIKILSALVLIYFGVRLIKV